MIPIYRAFSETFDKYILGVPYFSDGRYYMLVDDCNKNNNIGSGSYPIDETTLSIHFPDMLDSKRNKIFASLQKDGKGGDIILEPYLETERETALTYENYIKNINKRYHTALYSKIIGIQQ